MTVDDALDLYSKSETSRYELARRILAGHALAREVLRLRGLAPPPAGAEQTCENCQHRRLTYDNGTKSPAWCGELTDPTNRNAAVVMCGYVKFCGAFAPRTEEPR